MPDITPTYLTTGPTGDVSAEFPGGVQILATVDYPTATPPNERRIRWVKEGDGYLVAQLVGADNLDGNYLYGNSFAGPNEVAMGSIGGQINNADGSYFGRSAALFARTYGDAVDTTVSQCWALTDGNERMILNGAGESRFVQLPVAAGVHCIPGRSSGAGVKLLDIDPNGSYTITKLGGLGAYQVDIAAVYAYTSYMVIVGVAGAGAIAGKATIASATRFTVGTFTTTTGANIDAEFHFITMGLR